MELRLPARRLITKTLSKLKRRRLSVGKRTQFQELLDWGSDLPGYLASIALMAEMLNAALFYNEVYTSVAIMGGRRSQIAQRLMLFPFCISSFSVLQLRPETGH